MNQLKVGGIIVDVVRKDINNLHLAVYPPTGRVRIATPLLVSDESVRLFVISKLAWIKKQKAKFAGQERQTKREYVSGESHYFEGSRYLLKVIYKTGAQKVVVRNKKYIDLYARPGTDSEGRGRILTNWYRREMKKKLPALVDKWQQVVGTQANAWGIERMKTRWGTCKTETGRIRLNLELVKKPKHCLEYIIVHELVHLIERRHNDRFVSLMDKFLPNWRLYQNELNELPLGFSDWIC
jgi:predicted metal-dependent hydrolase